MEPSLYVSFARDLSYQVAFKEMPDVSDEGQRQLAERWFEERLKPFEESVIALAEKELGWGECDGECEEAARLRERIALGIRELEG